MSVLHLVFELELSARLCRAFPFKSSNYQFSVTTFKFLRFVVMVIVSMVIIVMIVVVTMVVRAVDVELSHVLIVDLAESAQVLLRLVQRLVTVPPEGKTLVVAGLLVSTVHSGEFVVKLAVEFRAVELGQSHEGLGEVGKEEILVLSVLFNPLLGGRVL